MSVVGGVFLKTEYKRMSVLKVNTVHCSVTGPMLSSLLSSHLFCVCFHALMFRHIFSIIPHPASPLLQHHYSPCVCILRLRTRSDFNGHLTSLSRCCPPCFHVISISLGGADSYSNHWPRASCRSWNDEAGRTT